MPSQNYSNTTGKDTFDVEAIKRSHSRYVYGPAMTPEKFGPTPRHLKLDEKAKLKQDKAMKRNLRRLQKSAPAIAAGLAGGKMKALKNFFRGLFRQIDISTDWLFILLVSFGLLKDILDIVFALVGVVVIGIIVSFIGDLLFLILTVTVLILVGSSLKNRGLAKYFLGIAMEFIAEALPAISWLPWTVIYVLILYLCVLFDRATKEGALEEVSA